jgi:hypothetical protein
MSDDIDLVKMIQENLNQTPQHRIGDINILLLAKEVQDLRTIVKEKLQNGLSETISKIWNKLNSFQCAVEILRIDGLEREIKDIKNELEQ